MSAPLQDDDWQWLTHPDIEPLSQRFHIGAVGYWTARGWVPCDPPAEYNPVTVELLQAEQAAAAALAEQAAVEPETTSKAKKSAPPAPEGSE